MLKKIRIYQPGAYGINDLVELSPEASQHVGITLRKKIGDKLILFCGNNHELTAKIVTVSKKRITVVIERSKEVNRESPRTIHLAQAISKGARMETVVQKAVELGVTSITPLITERCVVKLDELRWQKKRLQWQAIAISACEQSGRNHLPFISPPLKLLDFIAQKPAGLTLVLNPYTNKTWRDYNFDYKEINLLIGPEGGWSEQESALFGHYFIDSLSLGPRTLRTETAAIAALSVLQAVCGDL